jgi:thiosulfate reductase cytochrome b subunit
MWRAKAPVRAGPSAWSEAGTHQQDEQMQRQQKYSAAYSHPCRISTGRQIMTSLDTLPTLFDLPAPAAGSTTRVLVHRHPLLVRLTHWLNVVCLTVLLLSGLQIFNAHPALYWGEQSHFDQPLFAITAQESASGELVGRTSLFGRSVETTGFLGVSSGAGGARVARGFPAWLTLPSGQDLASGRRWHFLFAWAFVLNGAAYLGYALLSGHAWHRLRPTGEHLRGMRGTIGEHLRFHFLKCEEAHHYNVLQKLTYLAIIFLVLPIVVLTGLTMSPGMNAALPELVTVFGGRQSARTIHFLTAGTIVLFVLMHVGLVLVSGFWNAMRSMITGRYAIDLKEDTR